MCAKTSLCRGTSLIRNRTPLRPTVGSEGVAFSCERGTPVGSFQDGTAGVDTVSCVSETKAFARDARFDSDVVGQQELAAHFQCSI